ncbi:MAG TPA: alkaline phosphatase family protein [Candidatus Cybelea sp.]
MLLPIVACCLLFGGCSAGRSSLLGGQAALPLTQPMARPASGSPGQYISHIVVIVQENRSFENFFAGYPNANAPMSGCAIPQKTHGTRAPNVARASGLRRRSSSSGCPPGDVSIPLQKISFAGPDLAHSYGPAIHDYDKGKMDGFSKYGNRGPYEAYSYVDPSLIGPYMTIAQQYVLADAMFPTEFGGSFTGHLTLVAGNDAIKQNPSESEVDFPNGLYDDCDSPPGTKSSYLTADDSEHFYAGPFPCFDQFSTIANALDKGGVSWKFYATKQLNDGMWEPFEAIKYTRYGQDWKNIIAPQTKFLSDAGNGGLATVNWVTPSKEDSDHPKYRSDQGPSWVASVVNAVGESSYWSTSAIIILWDDWGGWYDNAAPPHLDYRGLGIRVPCLIISPYAKQGFVDHAQYEYGSILRFIEHVNNLQPIGPRSEGYTDTRATSLENAFDFTQKPRPFTAIPSKYPLAHFLHEPRSNDPIDYE